MNFLKNLFDTLTTYDSAAMEKFHVKISRQGEVKPSPLDMALRASKTL